jgi:hypothetical protein
MYPEPKSIVAIVRIARKAGGEPFAPPVVKPAEIVEPKVSEELAGGTFQELNSKGNSTPHW